MHIRLEELEARQTRMLLAAGERPGQPVEELGEPGQLGSVVVVDKVVVAVVVTRPLREVWEGQVDFLEARVEEEEEH